MFTTRLEPSRIPFLVLLAAGLALPLAPARAQESPQPTDTFVERVEVNIVNLTVNVTDRDGRPVRGLGEDDFEVLVDGQPVEISNFFAVEGQADLAERRREQELSARSGNAMPPPEARPETVSYLAIFVDNAHISPKNRRKVFAGLRDFLNDLSGGNDMVMVVTVREELEVVQPFTNSIGDVVAAIDRLEKAAAEGPMWETEQRLFIRSLADIDLAPVTATVAGGARSKVESDFQFTRQQARMMATEQRLRTEHTIHALGYLFSAMSGLPERKAVLYLSDGIEMRPAQTMFYAQYDRFSGAAELYDFQDVLAPPELEADEYDLRRDFQKLADYAQAHRIILSSIDASGPNSRFAGSADARLRDSDSVAVAGYRPVWSNRLDILHTQNRQAPLQLMAEETGGQVLLNTRNYADFFRTFREMLDVYYSIGFAAEADGENERHEVVVNVKGDGFRVRHHRTYVDKTWEQQLSERTLSRVLLGAGLNELEFKAVPGEATKQDGKFVLPIHVFVSVADMSLVPQGDEYVADVSLAVIVKRRNGDTNPPQVIVMGVRLPKDDVDNQVIKTGEASIRLLVDAEKQEIGVGVRDQLSGLTGTTAFEIDPSGS